MSHHFVGYFYSLMSNVQMTSSTEDPLPVPRLHMKLRLVLYQSMRHKELQPNRLHEDSLVLQFRLWLDNRHRKLAAFLIFPVATWQRMEPSYHVPVGSSPSCHWMSSNRIGNIARWRAVKSIYIWSRMISSISVFCPTIGLVPDQS